MKPPPGMSEEEEEPVGVSEEDPPPTSPQSCLMKTPLGAMVDEWCGSG
jgi:hypothetical protein